MSSYEQHLSEAQAASFQALQDQLHSFQNEMAAAALLRTQLVDKDRQIDTIRHVIAVSAASAVIISWSLHFLSCLTTGNWMPSAYRPYLGDVTSFLCPDGVQKCLCVHLFKQSGLVWRVTPV